MVSRMISATTILIAGYLLITQTLLVKTSSDPSATQLILLQNDDHDLNHPEHTCPLPLPTSCHVSPGGGKPVDSCCTNTPGGQILLTQFWDSHPATGPSDSWTIHGLWPDNCDGSYEASCDPEREYRNITQILRQGGGHEALEFMGKYWKDQHGRDETFWEHEWSKHGTCISTLEPRCAGSSYQPQSEVVTFFNRTVDLFKSLPTYEWLKFADIIPSTTTTYGLDQLQEVSRRHTGHEAVWNCRGHMLNEVWWHFNTIGTVADGKFVHAGPVGPRSTCPHQGIQYLPKGHSGGGGGDHDPKHPNHPTHPSPSRQYFIYVVDSGGKRNGCLISNGNWYTRGTCASFAISIGHDDRSILGVSTRRGPCSFVEGLSFKCSKRIKSDKFLKIGDHLTHEGQEVFYSSKLPDGRTQVPILKSPSKYSIRLQIAPAA